MATEQEREAVARELYGTDSTARWGELTQNERNQYYAAAGPAIAMRDAAVAEALQDAVAERASLRAEIQRLKSTLAQHAEFGTGYSQQTVDAIVKERYALRAWVIELKTSRYDGGDEHM